VKIDNEPLVEQPNEKRFEYSYSASTAEQVDQILEVVNQQSESPVPDLSDVELRFEEASCYKALLRNPLFDTDAGPIARKVEQRVQNYIKQELRVLLGIDLAKPVQKDIFNDEEVKVLKMLISKVMNKPLQPQEKKELVVNRAHVDPPPQGPKPAQASADPSVVKRGRPAKPILPVQAAPVPVEPPQPEKEIVIGGKIVKVKMPKNTRQVRPAVGGPQPLPTLTADEAAMHMQRNVATTAPRSGLLGAAVEHAIKNGTESGDR
jgi:hypothetical protein